MRVKNVIMASSPYHHDYVLTVGWIVSFELVVDLAIQCNIHISVEVSDVFVQDETHSVCCIICNLSEMKHINFSNNFEQY